MEPPRTGLLGVFDTVFSPLNTATKVTKGNEASANSSTTITISSVAHHCASPTASKINQIANVADDTRTSTTCAASQLEPPMHTPTKTNNSTAAAASITIATSNTQSVSNSCSPTAKINHAAIAITHWATCNTTKSSSTKITIVNEDSPPVKRFTAPYSQWGETYNLYSQ